MKIRITVVKLQKMHRFRSYKSKKIIIVDSPVEVEVAATRDAWVKYDTCVIM